MARTTPVHSGYTIVNGTTTGTSYYKADTWIEYKVQEQSIENNRTRFILYFYTALADGQTSGTYDNQSGGDSSLTVNSVSGANLWDNSPYDYRSSTPMLIGSFDGWINHDVNGTKTISVVGSYSTKSSYISGGYISTSINLPAIDRGLMRINVGGNWKTGLVYVNVNGIWKLGLTYINVGGVWKLGI